jgi:hypothetical protein
VGFADGNNISFAPEDFNLLGLQETVPTVVMREMQDEKIIIIVDVDLRSLIHTSAVFNIEWVEVKIIFQKSEVLI